MVKSLVPAKLDEITASGAEELMIYVSYDIEFEVFIKSYACMAMIHSIYIQHHIL